MSTPGIECETLAVTQPDTKTSNAEIEMLIPQRSQRNDF